MTVSPTRLAVLLATSAALIAAPLSAPLSAQEKPPVKPPVAEMDHAKMDHSKMDHSKMDHGAATADGWKELDAYHLLIMATWHPAKDKNDLAPIRAKAISIAEHMSHCWGRAYATMKGQMAQA